MAVLLYVFIHGETAGADDQKQQEQDKRRTRIMRSTHNALLTKRIGGGVEGC